MDTLLQYLRGVVGPDVHPTKDPSRGDYQWNGAFKLAKERGASPRDVAHGFAIRAAAEGFLAAVEVAGPGFVNLRLSDGWLAQRVASLAADPYLGVPQDGGDQTVVVDYSSPNVAKRMHVGHLRSTVIGAAIDRLLRATGHHVVADNHVGDWGTPFGKLLVAWEKWRDEAAFESDPVGELERLYVRFNEEAETDDALVDAAREATVRLQQRDQECARLWQLFRDASMAEYQRVYDRLGVKFDVVLGESSYADDLDPLVDDLVEEGLAVESEGAIVLPLPDQMPPLLLRKKDGAALYATTDLATVDFRVSTWDPDLIVYVTDVRQSLHFKQVFAAARAALHLPDDRPRLVHVGFGMLKLPNADPGDADAKVVVSSRKGNSIPLMALLDEARARALVVVTEKNPDLPQEEREAIAEAVGVSAVVYADLSRDPASDVTFEWDRVLSLEGNTAPYLLYALARCHGIVRKCQGQPAGPVVLRAPEERALALALCRFPDAVVEATAALNPSVLAAYLYDLAGVVTHFHRACRVLDEQGVADPSRLALVHAAVAILDRGSRILGMKPLERM